ncbi:MAG TPA: hypothetical protein VEL76_06905 [Gemmataceae bacterium]|nr:hypothetical protein [Gemmataceae bacterium]
MAHAPPSALITDKGERVLLRLEGHVYELTQGALRTLLGLPAGSAGLGISIDGERLRFEFAADQRTIELSAGQLRRRLVKQLATGM